MARRGVCGIVRAHRAGVRRGRAGRWHHGAVRRLFGRGRWRARLCRESGYRDQRADLRRGWRAGAQARRNEAAGGARRDQAHTGQYGRSRCVWRVEGTVQRPGPPALPTSSEGAGASWSCPCPHGKRCSKKTSTPARKRPCGGHGSRKNPPARVAGRSGSRRPGTRPPGGSWGKRCTTRFSRRRSRLSSPCASRAWRPRRVS